MIATDIEGKTLDEVGVALIDDSVDNDRAIVVDLVDDSKTSKSLPPMSHVFPIDLTQNNTSRRKVDATSELLNVCFINKLTDIIRIITFLKGYITCTRHSAGIITTISPT
jgi:hypothetical protein